MKSQIGMTLLELITTLAVVAVLGAFAVPAFQAYTERAQVSRAVGDIGILSLQLYRWQTAMGGFPGTLAEAGLDGWVDPWEQPYRYLVIATASIGEVRRDRNLRPVNTDFDLYSIGPDGETQAQFTAAEARDDIVRANNGGFIGVAKDY